MRICDNIYVNIPKIGAAQYGSFMIRKAPKSQIRRKARVHFLLIRKMSRKYELSLLVYLQNRKNSF